MKIVLQRWKSVSLEQFFSNFVTYALPLLAIAVLLFFGAFFASSETAFTSISKIKVRQLLKEHVYNAEKIALLRDRLESLIACVLIGTNFVTTLISSLATAYTVNVFGSAYISYSTAVVAMLTIMFSEIIPKTLAAVKPVELAQHAAGPIIILQKVFYPINAIFEAFTNFIIWIESKIWKTKTPLVTEDELKTLIAIGKSEGTLEESEKMMLDRIFEFSDLHVYDIMCPRSLMSYVNVDDSFDSAVRKFTLSRHTRLAVYDEQQDAIVGVLHYKSLLFASSAITSSPDFVRICMKEPLFVPDVMGAFDLLQQFKKENDVFAVTVNEYGDISGIVTTDDILYAVFGRMTNRYSGGDIPAEERVTLVGAKEFLVPGDMLLDDVNDVFALDLYSEESDTLGGWLLERFGELPSIGAAYKQKDSGAVFIIEEQFARRIHTVRLRLL